MKQHSSLDRILKFSGLIGALISLALPVLLIVNTEFKIEIAIAINVLYITHRFWLSYQTKKVYQNLGVQLYIPASYKTAKSHIFLISISLIALNIILIAYIFINKLFTYEYSSELCLIFSIGLLVYSYTLNKTKELKLTPTGVILPETIDITPWKEWKIESFDTKKYEINLQRSTTNKIYTLSIDKSQDSSFNDIKNLIAQNTST
jgi:hypothetical protein